MMEKRTGEQDQRVDIETLRKYEQLIERLRSERNDARRKLEEMEAKVKELEKRTERATCPTCPDCSKKDSKIQELEAVIKSSPVTQPPHTVSGNELKEKVAQTSSTSQKKKNGSDAQQQPILNLQREVHSATHEIKHVLGPKPHSERTEMTVSQFLEQMDWKLNVVLENSCKRADAQTSHVRNQPCQNDNCARQKSSLQKKVEELTTQLYGPKCQRPECVKLRTELRQRQVAEIGQAGNIGKNMEKMTGGDYGKLIERFEALTTAPEGLYGELEKAVAGTFQAKELLSMVFKNAYHHSRETVSRDIGEMLKSLFVVGPNASREDMEDASRGYGRLLHAAGLKAKQAAHVDRLTVTLRAELQALPKPYDQVFQSIFHYHPSILREVAELAWEFVTLPSPMIFGEPHTIMEQTHEREFGHWNPDTPQAPLIYLRPVIYRSYQGTPACKAWVANSRTPVQLQPPQQNQGSGGMIQRLFGK